MGSPVLAQVVPPPPLEDTRLQGMITALHFACEPGGLGGTVTFAAQGQVVPFSNPANGVESGGYTGTFTESGTIRFSPFGNALRFDSTFTITTDGPSPTRIVGSKQRQNPSGEGCTPGSIDAAAFGATFEALIITPDGGRYTDFGRTEVRQVLRDTRNGADVNSFVETYDNSLEEPPEPFSGPRLSLQASVEPPSGAAPLATTARYTLTNDGTDALFGMSVSSERCSQPVYESGDADGDGLLDPGERWTYTCSQTYATAGSHVDRSTASATNTQSGLAVTSNVAYAHVTATAPVVTAPSAPVNVVATAGNGQATVTWSPPASDGGSAVTGYVVTSSPGGSTCTWSSGPLTCTVTGLANGTTYTFTVVAANAAGTGPPSSPSNPVVPVAPVVAPSAPVNVAATAGNGQATATWSPPASNGGSPVTGYVVTSSPGGSTCAWSSGPLTCTVTGLANGTTYTFAVVAANAAGTGPPSSPSNPVVPTDGVAFHPLVPARILDSRPAGPQVGPHGTPWSADESREVAVTGVGGVPAGAEAVVLNATVTGTTGAGFLTIWPSGLPRPVASSLNWAGGQTVPNAVTVKVGTGGMVSVFNHAGQAHVIFDVVGYYRTAQGAGFTPLDPARILDSRPAGPQVGPFGTAWSGGVAREVAVGGLGGVPAGAQAVVANVTVTGTTAAGFLTIWPAGEPRPLASNLNWAPGQTISNVVTVKLGTGGRVMVFNQTGDTDVIIDVVGSFATGSGHLFHPLSPARVLDSRPGGPQVGPYGTPWGVDTRDVPVGGAGGVPVGAAAALLNVTVTGATASSWLTVWPAGQPAPLASSLNWVPGQTIASSVTAKLGADGAASIRNAAGTVDVIADVGGWYG